MNKKCECLFCLMHCTECGSHNISFEFRPTISITNCIEDNIDFDVESGSFYEAECSDCGEVFELSPELKRALLETIEVRHKVKTKKGD